MTDYLFLRRHKSRATSPRQRTLLLEAADRQWQQRFGNREAEGRKVDCDIYKGVLYFLEIHQVFLDPGISLKKLSAMLEVNQTYVSNAVNRYFGCHLKELLNTYRVEYAKELLRAGTCPLDELPRRCGFSSKSAFYASFTRMAGITPLRYRSSQCVQPAASCLTQNL